MKGSSLTSSAGMAESEPSPRHRVSAQRTPQDVSATVHQYPSGIRTYPRCDAAPETAAGRAPRIAQS